MSKSLTKFLTSSASVAKALDWKKGAGSILSVSVCKDKIDLALASHPTDTNMPSPVSLPSIPLEYEIKGNRKALNPKVTKELASLVNEHHVCGFIVNWPVQKEGWCGAQCGRVLHTLDQIVSTSNVVSKSRPVCLWDSEHVEPELEDEWGRASFYSITSDKTVHKASEEQYKDPPCLATEVWNDFVKSHWPEVFQTRKYIRNLNSSPSQKDRTWLDSYEDSVTYSRATL